MNLRIYRLGATGLIVAACAIGGAGWAQQQVEQLSPAAPPLWPSRFYLGEDAFTVYPPQLERWEQNRLEGRAAVAVQAAGAEAPVFGAVSLSARTEVDAASEMVAVREIDVASGSFPTAADRAEVYLDAVRRHLATLTWRVAPERLQAELAIGQAADRSRSEPLRNDPPQIVYVQSQAILVPIDGEPVLQPFAETGLQRVVNTRALILQDRTVNRYFLYVAGYWFEAAALAGPWTEAQVRPMALDEARRTALADGSADLLDDEQPVGSRAPKVIVRTGPTELVQTDGPPQYAPIGRTDLLFVTNSPNRLFLDLRTQTHYVLLAGRWYRTASLARGVWVYVPGGELPADFAMIPEDHPTGSVRAAVPGTPQAQEAVIANGVPEIAAVKRSSARLEISYDGPPQFRPIEGTALEAAANAPVPVIRVDGRTYYALDNGVWFFSDSADGPWTAASSVPPAIYTIPRSHPLHYVTYVRVYEETPEEIYVGYTPGYVGSYVTVDSTVVYGTGWYYRPWIGAVWYAPPATWGFGFSFYYSWWDPWPRRAWWPAWRPVPCFRPAWGPWPHRHVGVKHPGAKFGAVGFDRPRHPHATVVTGGRRHDGSSFREGAGSAGDIYRRWDARSVSRHRLDAQRDARPSVRAADRGVSPSVPMSRHRGERGARLDHDKRLGDAHRSQPDSPRWIRPGDRAGARHWAGRPDAGPPHNTTPTQPGRSMQPPVGAETPRSPGMRPGAANGAGPRPRQFDGNGRPEARRQFGGNGQSEARRQFDGTGRPEARRQFGGNGQSEARRQFGGNGQSEARRQFDSNGRFEGRRQPRPDAPRRADRAHSASPMAPGAKPMAPQDARRWARRDDGAPPAAREPRPSVPPNMHQRPRGPEARSGRPDGARQLRAPPPAAVSPTPGSPRRN